MQIVILSDFVEANSGSALLITVLNKLGAVASKSSLNRHIIKNSAKHLEEGLLKLLKMIFLLWPQLIILIIFKVMLLCPQDLNIEAGMGPVCRLFSLKVC